MATDNNKLQQVEQTKAPATIKSLVKKETVMKRLNQLKKDRAPQFVSSIIQISESSDLMKKANPVTILNAAITAAALNLPIDKNLGYAWIVPYNNKQTDGTKVVEAQFQIGWKGYVQLALRTGQYQRINVVLVYENQFKGFNAMTEELDCDFNTEGTGDVVGYAGYFKLNNGFTKTVYWSRDRVLKHAKKYSKSFNKQNSQWNKDFDSMALKTAIKAMLKKWGILSIEMQKAVVVDQSIQREEGSYQYTDVLAKPDKQVIDIEAINEQKERQRILDHIQKSQDIETLSMVKDLVSRHGLGDEYADKSKSFEK